MIYKEFGNTGVKVSALGFGAMRLPMMEQNGENVVNEELAIPLMHRAFELGVNYIDTAPGYCGNGLSEIAVGKALKGWREKINLSTKCPIMGEGNRPNDYFEQLEGSLKRLDTDYIDFYHFWGINLEQFEKYIGCKGGMLEQAEKAKAQGMIRHISFSFHDTPENLLRLIDMGFAETLLCQYNFLDRVNEKAIIHAKEKGMGVVIMGPVGGGRLGAPSKVIMDLLPGKIESTAEMALRFVLSNPGVTVALSGMENIEMLEENVKVASNGMPLSAEELKKIDVMIEENKKLADLYCTGCNYCMPCPKGVFIPQIFRDRNYQRVYGLDEFARKEYAQIEKDGKHKNAEACVACGQCEKKCPQHIKIIDKLKECHEALTNA